MLVINNLSEEGSFYESAQVAINNKAGNRSRATSEIDEPKPASQSSLAMNYSQDKVNDLL
ncbi:24688_t:CDS:2, partial [Gigaspora margarita]